MAEISNSVVHLTMRFDKTILSIGTGVIYKYENNYFIVTAWHNLTGLHSETLKHLNKNLAIPNNVVVNLALSYPGIGDVRNSITLPLIDEDKSLFFIHPVNWPRIDVAVIPFDPDEEHLFELHFAMGQEINLRKTLMTPIMPSGVLPEICPIQRYFVPDRNVIQKWLESVEVTEELFIPGYPHNIQDYYAQPVWKRATIASSVQMGWNQEPKFLIDCASKSGMSGSPVLYYSSNGYIRIRGMTHQYDRDVAVLAGIYVGRVDVEGEADAQIGTVWNQSVIDEIIQAQCYETLPHEIQLSDNTLLESVKRVLAGCSQEGLANVKNPELPSRFYIRQRLMQDIKGRASPERALQALLEAATVYEGPFVTDDKKV